MPSLSLRLPDDLDQRLENEARRSGVPRSEVARAAIGEFLARRERERFMAEMVAEARTAYGNEEIHQDALDLEKDFLDLGTQQDKSPNSHKNPQDRWWK
ncbi:ribbon-helix-helix protein, CopG family [Geoalkalibacter subterraneus]|uniref:CopG family transcriptional regulator n=1 Tax=Geoalkalibacter subterraneus TaxID=483547 RepID=A0A0B5FG85_9BACT|nr:CopG family transcriptional regulator [Geoalkalibacter subterraneus]AJF07142.1 CopG family transcriptional regulator [Geoalkalibacter subterraneus]